MTVMLSKFVSVIQGLRNRGCKGSIYNPNFLPEIKKNTRGKTLDSQFLLLTLFLTFYEK